MIALLQGRPVLDQDSLMMVVGGVGYQVHAGSRLLAQLAGKDEATVMIHTHVREDAL